MSSNWIDKLNESNSRLHKEDVLKQALELCTLGDQSADRFLSFVKIAYDPMITFGITQVSKTDSIVDTENPWADFANLLVSLKNRTLTGNAARDSIDKMSLRFDSQEWNNFCIGVITKDLRSGISDKTINKICKNTKYQIPVFACQLATSCEDRPEMSGVKRLEPKLDGVRVLMLCTIIRDVPYVVSYSRNGKVFDNFKHIEKEIADNMKVQSSLTGHDSFILDGEVVGESFQQLMKQARRKDNVQAMDSVFHVFDFIPTVDFNRGFWNASLETRLKMGLSKLSPSMKYVKTVSSIKVDLDVAEGHDQLERYARDCVDDGYEGIMIKNLNAPYECRRTTFWLKWKPTISVDLPIVAMEEGTGRNSGRLGALVCEGIDHDKCIRVNVGSGFSDSDRDEWWAIKDTVIGQIAEVRADAVTKNQDGTYSLRFPRFLRFRSDK